ncbi:hypothetical protein AAHB50_31545 [Bacillus toyonensis]
MKNLETLGITAFFYFSMLVPSHSLYKELKVPQGTGRIFFRFATANLHPFRFATSLQNFFGSILDITKPIHPKATIWDHRLELLLYEPNR